MRTHVDLCSGIGGFALAARWAGLQTVGFCEIDPWCRRVLEKNWPGVPKHDDLKTLSADVVTEWTGGQRPWLLTGGYPCQPFSKAGKRRGQDDDRHLWPWIAGLVEDTRPEWCLFENVVGHVSMGLDDVLADLEDMGYSCWATVIPAASVGAPHQRDRLWIIAKYNRDVVDSYTVLRLPGFSPDRKYGRQGQTVEGRESSRTDGEDTMADADSAGRGEQWRPSPTQTEQPTPERSSTGRGNAGEAFGSMGDEAHGLPGWMARPSGIIPYWIQCDMCKDLWCITHAQHVADCPCGEPGEDRWFVGPGIDNPWRTEWEHGVTRTTDNETDRRNKLKALGNAVVPQIPYQIISSMLQAENQAE